MTQTILRLSQGVILLFLGFFAPPRFNGGVAACVGLIILFELMAWADRANKRRKREQRA